MKFYKFNNSSSIKEVGHLPQYEDTVWNGDRFSENSFAFQGIEGMVIGKPAIPYPILNKKAKLTDLLQIPLNQTKYKVFSFRLNNFIVKNMDKPFQNWQIKVYNDEIKFNYRSMKYEVNDKEKLRVYDYFIFHILYPKKDFINYTKSKFYSFYETENLTEYDKVDFLTQAQIKFYNKIYKKDKIKPKVNERKIIEDNLKFNNYKEFEEYRKNLKHKSKIYKITPLKLVFNTSNCTEDFFRITDNYDNTMGYYASERLKNEIEEKGFTGIEFLPLDKLSTAYNIEMI